MPSSSSVDMVHMNMSRTGTSTIHGLNSMLVFQVPQTNTTNQHERFRTPIHAPACKSRGV
eukprot:6669986-Karenia_brevis.AAC.1